MKVPRQRETLRHHDPVGRGAMEIKETGLGANSPVCARLRPEARRALVVDPGIPTASPSSGPSSILHSLDG